MRCAGNASRLDASLNRLIFRFPGVRAGVANRFGRTDNGIHAATEKASFSSKDVHARHAVEQNQNKS
jgi:hypothetical protein